MRLFDHRSADSVRSFLRSSLETGRPLVRRACARKPHPPAILGLAAALLGSALGACAQAPGDEFTYATNGASLSITGYRGAGGAVVIPESYHGLPIASVETRAFFQRSEIMSVTLGPRVANVGVSAFWGCAGLKSVAFSPALTNLDNLCFGNCDALVEATLPTGLARIGDGAFNGCAALTELTLPDTVTTIGLQAFSYCVGLSQVAIPRSVTDLDPQAFTGCSRLASLTVDPENPAFSSVDGVLFNRDRTVLLRYPPARVGAYTTPDTVTRLDSQAFADAAGLTGVVLAGPMTELPSFAFQALPVLAEVMLPDGLNVIGSAAFAGCVSLRSVAIPDSVTSLGGYAFSGCTGLAAVTLPPNLAAVAGRTFKGCSALTSVVVPDTATLIADEAFAECVRLADVAIGQGVGSIGERSFAGCAALTRLSLPASVTRLGANAFAACASLVRVTVDPMNPSFVAVDNVLFDRAQSTLVLCPAGRAGRYVVPNGVRNLDVGVFYGCASLTGVAIPPSVTAVQNEAFRACVGLTELTLPNSVVSVADSVFADCSSLTRLTVGSGLAQTGFWSLAHCPRLAGVYCAGLPPRAIYAGGYTLFDGSTNVVVYYLEGTPGWTASFADRPTAVWPGGPAYADWSQLSGLSALFPSASGETDDADGDGMTNASERLAGTDPAEASSVLAFEPSPRPQDLVDADRTALPPNQYPLYFQSVPGKSYRLLSAPSPSGAWTSLAVVSAAAGQKRVPVGRPAAAAFYRLELIPK